MPGRRVTSIAEDPDLEVFQDFDVQDPEEAPLKRRPWAADEDEHLKMLVDEHGVKSWAHIATYLHMRNGKQCRERWRNHLRPQLHKGEWSVDEDTEIWTRVQEMGTKWAQISELYMPNRTDNDIKNRWNSIIRKSHAPGGREWTAEETDLRNQFLGKGGHPPRSEMAARTKAARAEGEEKDLIMWAGELLPRRNLCAREVVRDSKSPRRDQLKLREAELHETRLQLP